MKSSPEVETGYPAEELELWRKRAQGWAKGGHDVFVYFIDGAKERAPAAAAAFLAGA